ncbi:MAG: 50S ribosomal protein L1 [Elusimicrobiota bacterium]
MRSKRYISVREKVDRRVYSVGEINEVFEALRKTATAKFDESIDISIKLGVDPKQSDQMVRGSVVLPHGTGKEKIVAVAAEGNDVEKALEAGADIAGKDKIIEEVNKGNLDFDILIATPGCMRDLAKLGRILGPRGLMPSPKSNTVSKDVGEAVRRAKKGQMEFRMDKTGVVHGAIGKVSFDNAKLKENFNAYLAAVKSSRPASAKGRYIQKISLSTTMGPGFDLTV